jgi:dihydrofolate reductase
MILSLIVAIAEDGAMGIHNTLPWHLPADLQFFKRTTMGKPVIMGSRTWESLGKKLPGRLNIVLSSRDIVLPEGVLLFKSVEEAIDRVKEEPVDEAFIIGGSKVFAEVIPDTLDQMYITRIKIHVKDADTFFPDVDYSQWHLKWEEAHLADEKNKHDYTFQLWERNRH